MVSSGIELEASSSKKDHSKAPHSSGLEIETPGTKTGVVAGSVKEVPPYQESDDYSVHEGTATDDYVAEEHKVVETAEDLVNQVLTVEDDPTLDPWTFRMFFLYAYTVRNMMVELTIIKGDSDCLFSHRFFRKSSTSSRKRSMSPTSSCALSHMCLVKPCRRFFLARV